MRNNVHNKLDKTIKFSKKLQQKRFLLAPFGGSDHKWHATVATDALGFVFF